MRQLFQSILRPVNSLANSYAGHPVRLATAALKTALFAHVFFQYGYAFAVTEGASMLPTFEVIGDWVITSRYYRRGRGIQVGDIVSFDSVIEPDTQVIKRALGLPGDYVLRDTPGKNDTVLQVKI